MQEQRRFCVSAVWISAGGNGSSKSYAHEMVCTKDDICNFLGKTHQFLSRLSLLLSTVFRFAEWVYVFFCTASTWIWSQSQGVSCRQARFSCSFLTWLKNLNRIQSLVWNVFYISKDYWVSFFLVGCNSPICIYCGLYEVFYFILFYLHPSASNKWQRVFSNKNYMIIM